MNHSPVSLSARARELHKGWYLANAISIATYLYVMVQFPTGNHDWPRMPGLEFYSYQVRLGRWFAPAVEALTWYLQLPVLNALLAVVGYVTTGFVTCFLIETCIRRPLPSVAYLMGGLFCALIPFSNWTFYFSWSAAYAPVAQLLCLAGLILVLRTPTWSRVAQGGLLICLSMATYQSTINTAATLFWFIGIVRVLLQESKSDLRVAMKQMLLLASSITCGAVFYKLSLMILKAFGCLANTYHFEFLTVGQMPRRLIKIVKLSFEHLIIPHPYFPRSLKLLLLALVLVGLFSIGQAAVSAGSKSKQGWMRGLLVVVAFALMVICTKIQFLIVAKEMYFRNRFASFGLTFLYLAFVIVALSFQSGRMKSILIAVCAFTVSGFIAHDLSWQDGWVKQTEHDRRYMNRIISRIESTPGFSYEKKYDLVQVGILPNIRGHFAQLEGKFSPYHGYSSMPGWAPENPYKGLEPRFQIEKTHSVGDLSLQEIQIPRNQQIIDHIRASRAWPDPSSVAIVGDDIVVLLSDTAMSKLKKSWDKTLLHGKNK